MKRYTYRLDHPTERGATEFVVAENKTEARQLIREAYRASTPTGPAFLSFASHTIVWLGERTLY